VVPRRSVTYKDVTVDEMGLPALLDRAPEVALIDELAHTNAPGLEHRKRYEDVADVLAAGIDVYSTVNVQHLESLNDQVAELTGVRVRETFPDSVLSQADEVVLVDLTPPALIERLRAGKVYPAARVPAALNGFFRIENLEALREVALRQVAEEVEAKRLRVDPIGLREDSLLDRAAPQAVGERLLALVTPQPASQRILRRAWRSAQRLGAELDVLIVLRGEPSEPERDQIDAFHRLASLLGARVIVEEGDDVAEVAARVAREQRSTYVLLGTPAPRSGLRRFSEPLMDRLVRALPGVDVRIVADRSKREWTPR
jgi:two-component system sensor histidine kinase KdpD